VDVIGLWMLWFVDVVCGLLLDCCCLWIVGCYGLWMLFVDCCCLWIVVDCDSCLWIVVVCGLLLFVGCLWEGKGWENLKNLWAGLATSDVCGTREGSGMG